MRVFLVVITALRLAAPALAQTPSAPTLSASTSYHLRPGDILKVDVWGNEQFSGQFIVDETGHIQYPIIGEIDAQDVTVGELRDRLRQGLEQLFKSPFVTVTPLFRMAVLGEVRGPGLYTVDPTLSVLDVVAMAGGPTANGNMNKIRLLRGGEALQLSFAQGRSLQEMGVRSGDQIVIPGKRFGRNTIDFLMAVAQLGLSIAIFVNTLP